MVKINIKKGYHNEILKETRLNRLMLHSLRKCKVNYCIFRYRINKIVVVLLYSLDTLKSSRPTREQMMN